MCGIAGYLGTGDRALLERMARFIRQRGPDDEGQWISADGRQGFAHQRLAILDLSANGHQPMVDEQHQAVICYNGEIYNFVELRDDLAALGWSFKSNSDTEVLLKGYLQYGCSVVDRLNGIFAFAIHDLRSGETFLARDHFGVKPLYVADLGGTVLFASELKSLLADRRLSRDLDHVALMRYLSILWSPGTATPLRSVRRLEPGSAMIVRDGRVVRSWRFFGLQFGGAPALAPEECVQEVLRHLRTAVRRQMIADVPVGAFLSGGVDSSAIVALAREVSGSRPMECFTIAPRGEELQAEGVTDDLPYARQVAELLGARLHAIPVDSGVIRQLGNVIYHLDEPQADPAAVNVMLIARLAREHGFKVLLSGTAGDDLFSGYRRHRAHEAERLWTWLPVWSRRAGSRAVGLLGARSPRVRQLRKAMQYADSTPDQRLFGYFHWADPALAASLLAAPVRHQEVDSPFIETMLGANPAPRGLDRMLMIEQRHFLADHNLLYTDKLTMAHGVEGRVPFLDRDLVAFVNSLPPAIKHRQGTGKWLLKKAMEPYLPQGILHRPKTGFGVPLRQWIRRDLVPVIDHVLSRHEMSRRGVFDADNVRALILADRTGKLDAAYTVFAVLCIEIWLRIFTDSSQPTEMEALPGL